MADNSPWSLDLLSFIIGLVVAGVLGRLLQRIRVERSIMAEPDRPMNIPTEETPNIVREISRRAFWRFIRLCVTFFVSVVVIAAFIYLMMQR